MLRRHPFPRSAPPAPSDTTSAAPIRMPGTCPPGNPQSNAPGRTATSVRSRGAGTPEPRTSAPAPVLSMRLEPLGQPAAPDHLDRAVADGGNPRAIDPPPAAAVAGRIAARHANRQSQRRKHGPHPLPRPAPDSPPHRVQLAHPNAPRISRSRHPTSTSSRSSSAEPTCRTVYSAAPNSPRCRSAASTSAVVAARNPPPSSTSIANSPRPRPSTRQRRSGILPSSDRGPGPPPTAVRLRRNVPSRQRPEPRPRVPHSHLPGQRRRRSGAAACPPATPHRAHRAARRWRTASDSPGNSPDTVSRRSRRRHRARGRLTGRVGGEDRRTAGGASPARPPRRRRHDLRSPGTSPATAAARRPQSASGSPSTVPVSSPAARDASPEDEHRSAAGCSPIAVPDFQTRGGPTTFCSAGRISSLREAYGSSQRAPARAGRPGAPGRLLLRCRVHPRPRGATPVVRKLPARRRVHPRVGGVAASPGSCAPGSCDRRDRCCGLQREAPCSSRTRVLVPRAFTARGRASARSICRFPGVSFYPSLPSATWFRSWWCMLPVGRAPRRSSPHGDFGRRECAARGRAAAAAAAYGAGVRLAGVRLQDVKVFRPAVAVPSLPAVQQRAVGLGVLVEQVVHQSVGQCPGPCPRPRHSVHVGDREREVPQGCRAAPQSEAVVSPGYAPVQHPLSSLCAVAPSARCRQVEPVVGTTVSVRSYVVDVPARAAAVGARVAPQRAPPCLHGHLRRLDDSFVEACPHPGRELLLSLPHPVLLPFSRSACRRGPGASQSPLLLAHRADAFDQMVEAAEQVPMGTVGREPGTRRSAITCRAVPRSSTSGLRTGRPTRGRASPPRRRPADSPLPSFCPTRIDCQLAACSAGSSSAFQASPTV